MNAYLHTCMCTWTDISHLNTHTHAHPPTYTHTPTHTHGFFCDKWILRMKGIQSQWVLEKGPIPVVGNTVCLLYGKREQWNVGKSLLDLGISDRAKPWTVTVTKLWRGERGDKGISSQDLKFCDRLSYVPAQQPPVFPLTVFVDVGGSYMCHV